MANYVPPENVEIVYRPSATFVDDTIIDFMEKCLPHHANFTWIIDSAKPHLTAKVADAAVRLGINIIYIPPRLTNLLQPADVCWFASFKKRYHEKWNEWAINAEKEMSIHGNTKSPVFAKVIQWISQI